MNFFLKTYSAKRYFLSLYLKLYTVVLIHNGILFQTIWYLCLGRFDGNCVLGLVQCNVVWTLSVSRRFSWRKLKNEIGSLLLNQSWTNREEWYLFRTGTINILLYRNKGTLWDLYILLCMIRMTHFCSLSKFAVLEPHVHPQSEIPYVKWLCIKE